MQSREHPPPGLPRTTVSPLPGGVLPSHIAEMLRDGLQQAIPFNLHNAVQIQEVGVGYGVASIPDAEHLKNHLGTQHGAALFAVAEAAAGAAYIGAFMDHLGEIRMNAQEVHITYLRWAKGPITARSRLGRAPQEILELLHSDGSLDLQMPSELLDRDGRVVSQMSFRFYLKLVQPSLPPDAARTVPRVESRYL
jgi:acyl-coenzyme A thioesterase PaaI-like protein